jgi:hypothetical protein
VNYQYDEVTAMVTVAYREASGEVREQGLAMGAEGIIGVELDSRRWRTNVTSQGVGRPAFKMIVTVVGTAVAPIRPGPPLPSPGARLIGGHAAPGRKDKPAARQAGLRITPVRHAGTTAEGC